MFTRKDQGVESDPVEMKTFVAMTSPFCRVQPERAAGATGFIRGIGRPDSAARTALALSKPHSNV